MADTVSAAVYTLSRSTLSAVPSDPEVLPPLGGVGDRLGEFRPGPRSPGQQVLEPAQVFQTGPFYLPTYLSVYLSVYL